jgi:hypothetical protein
MGRPALAPHLDAIERRVIAEGALIGFDLDLVPRGIRARVAIGEAGTGNSGPPGATSSIQVANGIGTTTDRCEGWRTRGYGQD